MALEKTVELRRLRYFIAVAHASGFRQAAATLGMAQPPLSQQIMALESQLGQRLFDRHSRSVELTEAGKILLPEAEYLVARAGELPLMLARASAGQIGIFKIAFTPSLGQHPIVSKILRQFAETAQKVGIRLIEGDASSICRSLSERIVDAALIRTPYRAAEDLRVEAVAEEPLLVAVSRHHRLAKRESVSLSELANEDFAMFERELAPGLYDSISMACLEAGFSMRISYHASQKVTALLYAASNICITIVPCSLQHIHGESVKMLAIDGPQPSVRMGLVTRRSDRSAMTTQFRRIAGPLLPTPP